MKSDRIIKKSGQRNVSVKNLPERLPRFLVDLVHTLVEARWRHLLVFLMIAYFTTWLFFAVFYYVIAFAHGDLDFEGRFNSSVTPCIIGATKFAGFFLLSVESQVSTGYGTWFPSEECPEAIFLLIVQLTLGVIIDATLVGIFYEKFVRPPKYAHREFSKHAVICQRDDKFCLLFRVADFRNTRSIDSKVRAYFCENVMTEEGEKIIRRQRRLKVKDSGRVFMLWPQTVCHEIDKESPLYDICATDLIDRRFEIIVSLTGESGYSGHTTQSRTSYLESEIFWGYRFTNIVHYDHANECYVADVAQMDEIERVDMPQCSAREFENFLREKVL